MTYQITNQRALRAAFWRDNPEANRKLLSCGFYETDTRCMFVDYVDHLCRDGIISEQLAQRVTL